jgi:hypothetical protein
MEKDMSNAYFDSTESVFHYKIRIIITDSIIFMQLSRNNIYEV